MRKKHRAGAGGYREQRAARIRADMVCAAFSNRGQKRRSCGLPHRFILMPTQLLDPCTCRGRETWTATGAVALK
ncbi:MAG: hypothetical protein ABIJ56_11830 [Pseudomonadota bacterium]